MTNEALAKVDKALSMAKITKVLIATKNENHKEETKVKKPLRHEITKKPPAKKPAPENEAKVASPEKPVVEVERTSIISQKIYEEKYKRLQRTIKESRKTFGEKVEKIGQYRKMLTTNFNSKLAEVIAKKHAMTSPCAKKLGFANPVILSEKLRIIEDLIIPKLEYILDKYKRCTEMIEKVRLTYEGWLYSRFYTGAVAVDSSSIESVQDFKKHYARKLAHDTKNANPTSIWIMSTEYVSCSELNIWLIKSVRSAKEKAEMQQVFLEVREWFDKTALWLQAKIGEVAKKFGAYLIKAFTGGKDLKGLLAKLTTVHYLVSSFRSSKRLICYSKKNKLT